MNIFSIVGSFGLQFLSFSTLGVCITVDLKKNKWTRNDSSWTLWWLSLAGVSTSAEPFQERVPK